MDYRTAQLSRCGTGKLPAFVSLLLFLVFLPGVVNAAGWLALAEGIRYKKITIDQRINTEQKAYPGFLHIFQIDPEMYRLEVITAKELGLQSFDAQTIAERTGAILAVNGGFFTPQFESLGLLVKNGRELNKLKWTPWWHIFQIQRKSPSVITKQEYKPSPDIEMAIEAGPRLLVDGVAPDNLKYSADERTAIGVTSDNKIMIAVTENYPVPTAEISRLLRSEGCYNALNLDGGSSTQIYANIGRFTLFKRSFGLVANGIGVFPR